MKKNKLKIIFFISSLLVFGSIASRSHAEIISSDNASFLLKANNTCSVEPNGTDCNFSVSIKAHKDVSLRVKLYSYNKYYDQAGSFNNYEADQPYRNTTVTLKSGATWNGSMPINYGKFFVAAYETAWPSTGALRAQITNIMPSCSSIDYIWDPYPNFGAVTKNGTVYHYIPQGYYDNSSNYSINPMAKCVYEGFRYDYVGSSASVVVKPHTGSTISASNCTISAGSNSCDTTVTWNTVNPSTDVALTSAVTRNPDNTILSRSNASTITVKNDYRKDYNGTDGLETFYLYNNGDLLAQATSTATCTDNSIHNGTVCACVSGTVQDRGECIREVNLKVVKDDTEVPLQTVVARSAGINSIKKTAQAVTVGSSIKIYWNADGFKNENIVCTFPDGSKKTGVAAGIYTPTTPPTSTTTYKITCTDTVVTPPVIPTGPTPSIQNIMINNVLTNDVIHYGGLNSTAPGTTYFYNAADDVNYVSISWGASNVNSCSVISSMYATENITPVDSVYTWDGNKTKALPSSITIKCTNSTSGLSSSIPYYFQNCGTDDICSLF